MQSTVNKSLGSLVGGFAGGLSLFLISYFAPEFYKALPDDLKSAWIILCGTVATYIAPANTPAPVA